MIDALSAQAFLEGLWLRTYQPEDAVRVSDPQERDRMLDVLIAMISGQQRWPREAVIKALGVLRDQRAVEPLLASLRTDENEPDIDQELLYARVEALVAIGNPVAILPLLANTDIGFNPELFFKLTGFDKGDLVRVLGEVTLNPAHPLRHLAFSLLGLVDDPRSIRLLIEMLNDPQMRRESVMSLGLLKAREAVPFLLPCAADPDGDIRANTAIALGELGDKQAIPTLLLLLNDEGQGIEIRMHAAIALGRLGNASGRDLVNEYIASGHQSYRWAYLYHTLEAVKVLHVSDMRRFIRMVNRIPDSHFSRDVIQGLIVEILAEAGNPAALPILERMLESEHDSVRSAAQQAIETIKGRMGEGGQ